MTHSNIDAEKEVLGAIFAEPSRAVEAVAQLRPEAFTDAKLRLVFEAISDLVGAKDPIDFITVAAALQSKGVLERAGGKEGLIALSNMVSSAAHLCAHILMLAQLCALRNVESVCAALATESEGIQPVTGQVPEFLQQASERFGAACSVPSLDGLKLVREGATKLQNEIEAGPIEGDDGLSFGFSSINELVPGLRGGEMIVVAARTSFGKTALVTNVGAKHALDGRSVLVFSLEMDEKAILERLAASRAEVDHYFIRSKRLRPDSKWSVMDALSGLAQSKLSIVDAAGQTLLSIRAAARRHKQRFGLDLIVVDYLQLVQVHGHDNRVLEVSSVSRGLKDLARELGVPLIAAAQLNRNADSATDEPPRLAHLRDSGSIEQDADIVILLRPITNPDGANDQRTVEAIVAKNRNGPLGTARLVFQPKYVRFVEEMRAFNQDFSGAGFNGAGAMKPMTGDLPGIDEDEAGANYD